jgi:hypothetical protein
MTSLDGKSWAPMRPHWVGTDLQNGSPRTYTYRMILSRPPMPSLQLQNESDVREDIAVPFLKALGYSRGTENDIQREHFLRYEALQLGRKKPNDLPLGGKADYLLTVSGAGRWVLETKPPYEEIDLDTVDQTISYARHPEVCGHYAAILNGRRFVLYDRTRSSNDRPLLDIQVTTGEQLAQSVESLLSPSAVRRDCGPPVIDLAMGIAKGFRSRVAILGGEIRHLGGRWDFPSMIPPQVRDAAVGMGRKLAGMVSSVKGGMIWRDDASRIRVKINWNLMHEGLESFMQTSKFGDVEYVCLDSLVSNDPENPSVFEFLGGFRLEAGQPIFSVLRWSSQIMQLPVDTTIHGQVAGYLLGDEFAGMASMQQIMRIPVVPTPISFHSEFTFSLKVDTR